MIPAASNTFAQNTSTHNTSARNASAPSAPEIKYTPFYAVGYGRPPRYTQFRKGQSGNPGGRPRREPEGPRANDTMLRQVYRTVMKRVDAHMEPMTVLEAIMQSQIDLALSGDARAQRDILNFVQHAEYLRSLNPPPDEDEDDEYEETEAVDESREAEKKGDIDRDQEKGDHDEDEDDGESGEDDETGDEPRPHAAAGSAVTKAPDAAPPAGPAPRRPALARSGRATSRRAKTHRTKSRRAKSRQSRSHVDRQAAAASMPADRGMPSSVNSDRKEKCRPAKNPENSLFSGNPEPAGVERRTYRVEI